MVVATWVACVKRARIFVVDRSVKRSEKTKHIHADLCNITPCPSVSCNLRVRGAFTTAWMSVYLHWTVNRLKHIPGISPENNRTSVDIVRGSDSRAVGQLFKSLKRQGYISKPWLYTVRCAVHEVFSV